MHHLRGATGHLPRDGTTRRPRIEQLCIYRLDRLMQTPYPESHPERRQAVRRDGSRRLSATASAPCLLRCNSDVCCYLTYFRVGCQITVSSLFLSFPLWPPGLSIGHLGKSFLVGRKTSNISLSLPDDESQAPCKASPAPSGHPSAVKASWKATVPCGICPSKDKAKKASSGTPSCPSPAECSNPNLP